MKKTLLVSSWAPPLSGGSSTIFARLMTCFPNGSYAVFTESAGRFAGAASGRWLPAHYWFAESGRAFTPAEAAALVKLPHPTSVPPLATRIRRRAARPFADTAEVLVRVGRLRDQILAAADAEQAEIILGTSGEPAFLVAAYLAARRSRRTLYVHLLDLFAENDYPLAKGVLARRYEKRVLAYADRLFVISPRARDYYRDRYGLDAIPVANPVRVPGVVPARTPPAGPPTVVYTGAVYGAQRDALANLVRALEMIPGSRLLMYTGASTRQLQRFGLVTAQVTVDFASDDEMAAVQGAGDILFLPLAFETRVPRVVETALPAKTPEYMVSGVPILVHAPAGTYLVEYARQQGWACVVDVNDPAALVQAIGNLATDVSLRRRLAERAFEVARRYHDQDLVARDYAARFATG